ncbi:MAG: hypothetical protein ACW98Y_09490 [Candidatus Thorarchaeota archaeon]|jgi:hypothetical protein
MITLFILSGRNPVRADTGYNINETIAPYTYQYWQFSLQQGDGIYSHFRITSGNDVYFFITDQEGHNDVQATGETSRVYKSHTFQVEGGIQHYWNYTIPQADTWYVYFSKALWAPVDALEVTVVGVIREDTDPPITSIQVNNANNLTGSVIIVFSAVDSGFPISSISLYIDNEIEATSFNNNQVNGLSYSDTFEWDTRTTSNGVHEVKIDAWDALNHRQTSVFHVNVNNPELLIGIEVILIVVVLFAALSLCMLSRPRMR